MKRYYYFIEFQYLGFRYHGWQKQENVKTIQGMVNRTLNYILDGVKFRTIASGRTDAMVSVNHSAFELFVYQELDVDSFFIDLNKNLPSDIRALSMREVDDKFNIIQNPKVKEYTYLFTYGEKFHPFCAPYMTFIQEDLDIELMKKGAKVFEGEHNFECYCYKPKPETQFHRAVDLCELRVNDIHTASFFPESSFVLHVYGKGFMRYQIRLMMGALIRLGRGEISLDQIEQTLKGLQGNPVEYYIAPSSGLMLNKVTFD
jgi:tRNA pseudouridine38-40 synthase